MKQENKYKLHVQYVGDFKTLCSICKTPLNPIVSQAVLIDIKSNQAIEGGHYGCINNKLEELERG